MESGDPLSLLAGIDAEEGGDRLHVRRGRDGALAGLDELLAGAGIGFADIHHLVHGTTLVTNAVIERRGARVALLTTRGFRSPRW